MKKLLAMLLTLCLLVGGFALAEEAVKPTKVTLADSKTVTVYIGAPVELGYKVAPEGADVSLLKWSTSSKKIATVADGVVMPVKEGTATITVKTPNGKKDSVKVKVVDPYKPTKVVLDASGTVTLNMGETLELNAALQPETAQSKLKWSTSSKKIATVADGVVTPVKEGAATITVKTANGKKDTVKVKVFDPYKPVKVVLDQSGTVTLSMGEVLELNAALLPESAQSKLKWSTSSKKIAVVDENGVVTPVKEGTATITVKTANGKKDTVKVKVFDPYKPAKVVLDQSGTVTLNMGEVLELNAALQPETAKSELKWSTSSKKIAVVDENGVVTPVKEGTATITVKTANGKKDSVKVKVCAPIVDVWPTSIELNKSGTVSLEVGQTLQLTAKLEPEGSKSNLEWSTSDSVVAAVSNTGLVKAVKEGNATITVKTENGLTDSVNIRCEIKESVNMGGKDISDCIGKNISELEKVVGPMVLKYAIDGCDDIYYHEQYENDIIAYCLPNTTQVYMIEIERKGYKCSDFYVGMDGDAAFSRMKKEGWLKNIAEIIGMSEQAYIDEILRFAEMTGYLELAGTQGNTAIMISCENGKVKWITVGGLDLVS